MKQKLFVALMVAFLSLLSVGLLPTKALADVQDFDITNFTADYYLSRNGAKTSQLKVVEKIEVEFTNVNQNHGIERAIPNSYQGHKVNLRILSVADAAGTALTYTTRQENDNTVLRIGDPNVYVYGPKSYVITYDQKNVISYQENDEFYWNVNGTQWPQAIQNITARIHTDQKLSEQLTGKQICFKGYQGSNTKDCVISSGNSLDENIITAQARDVAPYQTLTFDVEFKKDTFEQGPEVLAAERQQRFLILLSIAVIIALPLATLIYMFRKWKTIGNDPKGKGVIIPEYVAPKGLNVINSGYILEQKLLPKMLSAGIVQIAIAGFLQISEIKEKKLIGTKTDYELKIIKDIHTLSKEQKDVVSAFFGSMTVGSTSKISTQKNKLYSTLTQLKSYLAENLTTNGYFVSNPEKARNKYFTGGIFLLVSGLIMIFLFPIGLAFLLSGIIVLTFSPIMPSRTDKGVTTRDYLLGLKEYIKLAEADRIAYLQSPKGVEKKSVNPKDPKQVIKLFEELLPYAMLFGLEKEWAEQFSNLYTQPPGWYSGNMSTFNAIYLANAMSGFNSASNNVFTAPSSSGSSGFGGGGFSGGGGGGGGGGGW